MGGYSSVGEASLLPVGCLIVQTVMNSFKILFDGVNEEQFFHHPTIVAGSHQCGCNKLGSGVSSI